MTNTGQKAVSPQRRSFLRRTGIIGAATALAALTVPEQTLADSGDAVAGTFVGAWLGTITSTDGSFPTFQTLFTCSPGGGLVATASIDSEPGLKSGPTHGAWRRLGEHQFSWTAHAFSFDDSGHLNGTYNIHERLTVANSGNSYSGSGTFEVVNGPGAFPLTRYNVSAVRISA